MLSAFKLTLVNGRNLRAHNLPLHVFIRSSADNSASSLGKIIPLVDPAMQTRALPDGSRISKYNKNDEFVRFSYPDAKTLYETIRRGSRLSENGAMLGQREKQRDGTEPYVWISYNENTSFVEIPPQRSTVFLAGRAENIAQAFRRLGLNPGQGTFIGIFSKNCPEWVITEHAAYTFSNVLVPLYETLGPETSAFIINHTEIELVVCDTQEKAKILLHNIEKFSTLKHIVCIDSNLSSELRRLADKAEINLYTFHELHRLGVEVRKTSPHVPPKPEDLATICYTSGTTGIPKGVMLTHGNVIADATIAEYFKYGECTPTDSMLSFLPMAHMFERVMQTTVMLKGGRIGFFRGDIQLLIDDIQALKPSIMPVVPRVLNRLYHDVMLQVSKSPIKKLLFKAALVYKTRLLQDWVIRDDTWADKLVFRKIREKFGGRMKLMVTGSAPLSSEVLTFVRCVLGCVIVEGYGLTECVAGATITIEGDPTAGHVGIPAPCNAVKLIDVPELGYFTSDGKGEVCIRGTNVFEGYYKNEEQTCETLDADGWLHTGDIGTWTDFGTLKIIDRKKHIFKLSQGEYIAPEKIENAYIRSRFVIQSFVYGDSLKEFLVAIIVPDMTLLQAEAAQQLGITQETPEELCRNPQVMSMVMLDMENVARRIGLQGFEQVRKICLSAEAFTIENDLLTPTMKSKRPKLQERFKKEIEEMYNNSEHVENKFSHS